MNISPCLYLNFVFSVEVHLSLEHFNETNTWNKYKYNTLRTIRDILNFYEKNESNIATLKRIEVIKIDVSYF